MMKISFKLIVLHLFLLIEAATAVAANNGLANGTRSLEVDKTFLKANNRAGTYHIEVKAGGPWSAVPVANIDGSSFLTISENGNRLDVRCPANPDTKSRSQKILIKMDDMTREITVRQSGLGIVLYTDPTIVNFNVEGGKKKVTVHCNSNMDDGEGGNWQVASCPEWVNLLIDKSRTKVNDKDNILQPMNSLDIRIICKGLASPAALAHTGRKGTVILASNNKRCAVTIVQNGTGGAMKQFAFGASLEDVEADDNFELPESFNGGIRVKDIYPGGSAEEFGFHAGDIVIEVDGKSANCVADFTALLNTHQPDEMVRFKVIRDGTISTRTGLLRAVRKL